MAGRPKNKPKKVRKRSMNQSLETTTEIESRRGIRFRGEGGDEGSKTSAPTVMVPSSSSSSVSQDKFLSSKYQDFTFEERGSFLNGLKEKGFSVIHTPEKLMPYLPGRTVEEIKMLIQQYKSRGQRFNAKKRAIEKNEKKDDGDGPAAIQLWYKTINNLMTSSAKNDDLAMVLTGVVRKMSDSMQEYTQVLNYIADCMEGKYPVELETKDSLVVVSLLQDLSDLIRCRGLTQVEKYLTRQPNQETDQSCDSSVETATSSSPKENLNSNPSTSTSTSSLSSAKDVLSKYIEECTTLPKIRKIKECLNPLDMNPMELNKQLESDVSV